MWSFAVAFSWIAVQVLLVQCADVKQIDAPYRSCLDHLKSCTPKNGFYSILDQSGATLTVYCDFESEPGSAWTLVMSWALKNKDLSAFKIIPLTENALVNEKTPNWNAYRQSKKTMDFLKSQSSHWRVTCSFNRGKFDYRDYLRASFKDFDVTTYVGDNQCKKVEYIDIRGHGGYHTTAPFWQRKNLYMLHTDSEHRTCPYNAATGAVPSEDNFGLYDTPNKNFRCTADPSATTQYWFGGYA